MYEAREEEKRFQQIMNQQKEKPITASESTIITMPPPINRESSGDQFNIHLQSMVDIWYINYQQQ